MKIDPQTITLDANDRAVIVTALAGYADQLSDEIARARNHPRAWTEKRRMDLDRLESERARAEDLLSTLRA